MKKIILTIFVFFLSCNIANACDITFVNFGDNSDKLIENQASLTFGDQFNGQKILGPNLFICSENEKVKDTMVEFLLSKISLY